MSGETLVWWVFLCAVGVANIAAWSHSARALSRRRAGMPGELFASRRWLLLLSAGYVFGCAYRSFLPVYDVPRICMVDSWLSSVIVGRSVATVAELCFAAQWTLLLWEWARATGSSAAKVSAALIFPLIAIAETFSWYSVTTTSNAGHVIEETLWGFCAALIAANLIASWPRVSWDARPWFAALCAICLAYVGYMFLVDVPMYLNRWLADEAEGRAYLGVAQGAMDAANRWVVSGQWQVWKGEVVWMSLYFSVAVWLSIASVHLPALSSLVAAPSLVVPGSAGARDLHPRAESRLRAAALGRIAPRQGA
jgi:hypothetical protein